jgi:hypothetical protein
MNTQDSRSKKWRVVIPVIIIALVVGWYWFRPERLVTNRRVDEAFPAINNSAAQILESGTFHSGTHPTEGTATIYRIENGSRVLRFTNFKTSNGPDVHIYMVAPKTPGTTQVWNTLRSSIWDSSRGTSATKTTFSAPI